MALLGVLVVVRQRTRSGLDGTDSRGKRGGRKQDLRIILLL